MDNVNHLPLFDTKLVEDHYTKKDGVPVKYVCTTSLHTGASFAADVFYRSTCHPEFGNRYFALYYNPYANNAGILITNADCVEKLNFDMIEDNGILYYSRHRHDVVATPSGYVIDGGRGYTKMRGNETGLPIRKTVVVKDGKFELLT